MGEQSLFQIEVDGMFLRRKSPGFWLRVRNVIWPKMGLSRAWRYLVHRMARLKASPHTIALGFAAGAFASFTPFVGLHFIIAGLIAFALRSSILASAIGTVVGNPLTFPFIWLATYNVGAALLGREAKGEVVLDLPAVSESAVNAGMMDFAEQAFSADRARVPSDAHRRSPAWAGLRRRLLFHRAPVS